MKQTFGSLAVIVALVAGGSVFGQEAGAAAANPASEVARLLKSKSKALEKKADGLEVDLGVLEESGSLEAQLKEARAQAELKRVREEVKELESSRRFALLAAKALEVCSDKGKVESVFNKLGEEAAKAKVEVQAYQQNRVQRIEEVKSQAPVQEAVLPLDVEVGVILGGALDAMGGKRQADFLAMVYAVAAELKVRVPQRVEGRAPVYNDYAAVLNRSRAAEQQMALLTLVAYANRQKSGLGGTILGKTIGELVESRAVTPGTGRGYTISKGTKNEFLLKEIRAVWGEPELVIGGWDLTNRQKTAEAMAVFATGDEEVPDGEFLGLVAQVKEAMGNHARGQAIVSEVDRLHADALARAKRYDAGLEKAASVVFQAEGLQKRQGARLATIASGMAYFEAEAVRLGTAGEDAPDLGELKRHANALNDAAISIGRAEGMLKALAEL